MAVRSISRMRLEKSKDWWTNLRRNGVLYPVARRSAGQLDLLSAAAHTPPARQLDGRCGRGNPAGRGKSGLHGNTVPANGRRGRPQGKCHRKQTACARQAGVSRPVPRARAKRCGKSAPRPWQQGRHGKPHREQDRIGAAVMSRLQNT